MVSASGKDIINPLKHKLLENVSHKITKFSTNKEWRNEAKTYLIYIKLYVNSPKFWVFWLISINSDDLSNSSHTP